MKQSFRKLCCLFLGISLLTFIQCKKQSKYSDELNPAFTEKIVAFTSGVISAESTIRIILAEDNNHAGEPNSLAKEGLFRFKPAIKGQTVWIDKRTLEFRPTDRLKSGETYHSRFSLGDILEVDREISVFEFDFSVVEQNWSLQVDGYQTHNENDLVWNRIKGEVNTADNIEFEQIKKYFTSQQEKKKLKMLWEPSEDKRVFHFTIDSVRRTEKAGKVVISWDGSPEFPKVKGNYETEIPSLADYKILDIKVIHQPEQYIQIIFSDPIKKNQALDGLIFMDNGTSLEYALTGNVIKAFPAARQNGAAKLTIREGLMNILGYGLKETHSADITFEIPKPAIRLTGKGVILPSSKGMVFPFEAVNLNAVDVKIIKIFESNIGHFLQVNKLDGNRELKRAGRLVHKGKIVLGNEPANLSKWNRFHLDLTKLIEPDLGAIYRIELSFRKSYSLYPCEGQEAEEEELVLEEEDDAEMEYEASYWDSYEDYYDEYDYDDYNWEERENPCSSSFYASGTSVARNILASDLGIIAKSGSDKTVFCAVTSLITSEPIQGVEVIIYNYQQQNIGSGITDNNGFATISVSEKPFLLIARSEKQRGYLRLDDGSSLSLGAFDVAGRTVPKGLKAFLYGERGVWRPGDTLFLTCILEDKLKKLPINHPVVFELYNPKGQLFSRATKISGVNGFYNWTVATPDDAITGNYNLKVKVGGTLFYKILRIETIKPNRLKINLDFGTTKLSFARPEIKGNMKITWLHGAVASNLKANVTVALTNAPTVFDKYPAYQFTDPAKSFRSDEQTIFDGFISEEGTAQIPGKFSASHNAPGMLNAHFTTRVFEKSGDFSIDRYSMPYSPYSSYVGLKTPEGDKRGMLLTDTTQWVDVVILDEMGAAVSRSDVEAYVYKLNWRNWWESFEDELADYIGNTYNQPIVTKKLNVTGGKGRFGFRIDYPEWGRFYIRVVDPVSGHSAGKIVFIDWPGWAGRPMRDNPEAASMLNFNTDKQKYQVGETAEVVIPASGKGKALMSIESGSRILRQEWIDVNGNEIRHKFEVTDEMTPNVYIHVTLIQPHVLSENDMPMRLYGVIPLFVEDPDTRLSPVITMPEVLEPLQKFTVRVSEKSRLEMTYTLAIVEEGLLDLTRYNTPDPWGDFYAREALGIRTWDLYDMVIGAYGGKLTSLLGIGGDEDVMNGESAEKANRFKPVVKYLGPFTLKAGKTNSHNLIMPNYIGSVRAMVIAGQSGAYGSTEMTVPVKKPLMVLATLPRVLGPGETVKFPVTVFAMDKQIRQVSVSVKTDAMIELEGERSRNITFEQPGDKVVDFDLKIASKTGISKVQVTAVSGKYSSTYEIELDVRNANPPVTTFVGGSVEAGKTQTVNFKFPGMQGSNSAMLEVSGIPPIDAERRLRFLITYPHGCIEQITSSVFPQLFLPDLVQLDEKTKASIDGHIKAGIIKLQSFQQSGGGFSYWPGQSDYSAWGSSYAGHFLLEAEKKGYAVPTGLKAAWLKSQKQRARQWTPLQNKDAFHQDDLEQAYRLYTLALAGEPEMSAMNRLRTSKSLSLQAKWRLAATYALSGQKSVAKELVERESTEIQPYNGLYSSYGSKERDWAMFLETLIILDDKVKAAILTRRISEALSSDSWMSTQSVAYCLLAVSKFASFENTSGKISFSYKQGDGKTANVTSNKAIIQVPLFVSGNVKEGSVSIINNGKGILFTRIIMEGIPEAGNETEFNNNINLDISYFTRDGKELDVTNLSQGTDFMAVVSVLNPGAFHYRELALTQIFPPGWEILNNRMWDNELAISNDAPDYQDIRDDRVLTYFDLAKGKKKSFTVQLSAAYTGRYYLTGAYCEAMYDNSISAMIKGSWVEVKKAGE